MNLCEVYGQAVAGQILSAALALARISHAYLFVGPEGTGKTACALEFARALAGATSDEHPDVMVVEPDGASFKIDQARKVQRELSLSPTAGIRRVAVLKHADKMTVEAANSLLKLLEEPPKSSVIILVASNPSALLPTVLSRCQMVPFRPASLDAVQRHLESNQIEPGRAATLAALSAGIIGRALSLDGTGDEATARAHAVECLERLGEQDPWTLAQKLPRDRAELIDTVSFIAWFLRDAIAKAVGSEDRVFVNVDSIKLIEELACSGEQALQGALKEAMLARNRLERNANMALTLEFLLLKLEKLLTKA